MILDEDEVLRINRIVIAEFLHIKPEDVDTMPLSDVEDILEILWARQKLAQWKT